MAGHNKDMARWRPKKRKHPVGEQMMKQVALLGSVALVAMAGVTPAAAQFRAALNESKAAVQEGARSQQTIDNLDDQAAELLGEFRAAQKQLQVLRQFNESRAREIENQLAQIRSLEQDSENIEDLQRAILPLIEEMVDRLEVFIAADIPFLAKERSDRIARLRGVLNDPNQTPASRYGLILEAYQIENEYGRIMDTYTDTVIEADGTEIEAEFLQIGRLALIYKNADDSILRIYNRDTRDFEDLDMKFLPEVRRGIRMAKEQTPPDLLQIPVTAPSAGGAQ